MANVNRGSPDVGFQMSANGDSADDEDVAAAAATVENPAEQNKNASRKNALKVWILSLTIILAAIGVAFNVVSNGIDAMLLSEKLIEKQIQIGLVVEQTDRAIAKGNDWTTEHDHYIDTILTSMETIDELYMTYAAVFDEGLQNVSARSPSYEGSAFEPTRSADFVAAISANDSGDFVMSFTPGGAAPRDMYIHYRWLPSDAALENRVLAVVAISEYTINTRISTGVQILSVFLAITTIIGAILTWRRRMAESLNRTLEATVRQRTKELEEQTDTAQKASMAKSDFLSNMSHEIRTPMNAIIGMTTIAKNTDDLSRKDYCLKKIEDASAHLLSVINDILDMSKIEANKFELSFETFNFERVLQKVANVIIFRVDEKHQDFSVHIDKNLPLHLIGDDQRLSQVITNLMSNAVKFTPDRGSIRLNAYLLEEIDNACTIQIEVTDTGIGITAEQQEKLFNSFVQAESSTTRKYGGSGLGLAISKQIVEMMGGSIWVESEPDKGSTFAFTIKVERVVEDSNDLLALGVSWANMSVLVVDDATETREYFVDIMQRFGSKCDVASSGEEACDLIDAHGPYNLYFVDWRMPGMDGIELARRINTTDNANKSVIIMISANEWHDIEDSAKDAGVSRFLSKPLFPSNIADCINECLGSSNVVRGNNENNYTGIFKEYRILLAEDVDVNREIVLALLDQTELNIDIAENGLVAYKMFHQNPDLYDSILMDVQMPEMDGYDATMKIRALGIPRAKEIPIIAMTANVFREDIEKCLACGMNDHLGKPVNYEKLISKLCEYLFVSG